MRGGGLPEYISFSSILPFIVDFYRIPVNGRRRSVSQKE
jgi:hypothetical protein